MNDGWLNKNTIKSRITSSYYFNKKESGQKIIVKRTLKPNGHCLSEKWTEC